MKHIEYSISDLLENLKCNKKRMLLMFIILILISLAVSFFLSRFYNQDVIEKDNTVVPQIMLEEYTIDETYFYQVTYDLKTMVNALDAYAQYLHQVDLNGENSEQLVKFQDDLASQNTYFEYIGQFYISNAPIYTDNQDEAVIFVEQNIEQLETNIDSVSDEIEELNEAVAISSDGIAETEQILYDRKSQYESKLEIWEKHRKNLENYGSEEVAFINEQMEELLQKGVEEYNLLANQFNEMISQFEDEQYDIVYNPYLLDTYSSLAGITGELKTEDIINVNKNSALIYARSIASLDNDTERFYSCFTFGLLLSTGLSVLYGLFRKRNRGELF